MIGPSPLGRSLLQPEHLLVIRGVELAEDVPFLTIVPSGTTLRIVEAPPPLSGCP